LNSRDTRRKSHLFFFIFLYLCVIFAVLVLAESAFRIVYQPRGGFAHYLFHNAFAVERWTFLNRNVGHLQMKPALRERPNVDEKWGGEQDRPPFDRIKNTFRVQTNSDGYRDKPFRKEKPKGTQRIFVIGDSISFGHGVDVDERYANLLERRLSSTRKTEIYDFGIPSCTTACMAENLRQYIDYAPDLVIMQVSANDLDLALWEQGAPSAIRRVSFNATRLLSGSRLLLFGVYLMRGDHFEAQMRRTLSLIADSYKDEARKIFDLCRVRGIKVVMVSVPYSTGFDYSASAARMCKSMQGDCLGMMQVDFRNPQAWIPDWSGIVLQMRDNKDWVMETGEMLGLREDVMNEIFPYRFLFTDIVHPNKYGHIIIAEQLYRFMQRHPAWGGDYLKKQ